MSAEARTYTCRYCKSSHTDKSALYNHIRSTKKCSDKHHTRRKNQKDPELNEETITFGKYKDLSLNKMIRDRKYCDWLVRQDWFAKQYEYLYNRVQQYQPQQFFFEQDFPELKEQLMDVDEFLAQYKYFQLLPSNKVKTSLTDNERKCYKFYRKMIKSLKDKITHNPDVNPYNIKAPSSWLKQFEKKYQLGRSVFKEFLNAYELPNLPYIVEDIKKMGGIEYKGARSFIIAKKKSLKQEKFWELLLKAKYGEDIGSQFKFHNCIFDFIQIKTNTLYECKLGLKDFNEDQHNKYLLTLGTYTIIYLIGEDCVIDVSNGVIFTTDRNKYRDYLVQVPTMKDASKFDNLIREFSIEEVSSLIEHI